MKLLEPWRRGGSHDVAAIAARLGWLWRAVVVASLYFYLSNMGTSTFFSVLSISLNALPLSS